MRTFADSSSFRIVIFADTHREYLAKPWRLAISGIDRALDNCRKVLDHWRRIGRPLPFIRRLNVRTPHAEQPVAVLSGGNQQKCILARWLLKGVRVLILDEPTRGIDVGAKREIYTLVDQLAREGMAVLLISSELPEVLGMADRILVVCEGRLTADLPRADATPERVMHAATASQEMAR